MKKLLLVGAAALVLTAFLPDVASAQRGGGMRGGGGFGGFRGAAIGGGFRGGGGGFHGGMGGGGFRGGMGGGGFRGAMVGGGFRGEWVEALAAGWAEASVVRWWAEASAAPVCVVGSSGPAASRSGQDLPHALLVSIGLVIAASPSRRCHSPSALVSMAARVGLGNRRRGAGSGSGPATTTTGTTDRGGPALRDSSAAWLRWILGSITPPISPRLPA